MTQHADHIAQHPLPEDTGRPTRVLAVVNGSAGSGKTTFSAAVGYAAAARKKKVCILGLDKQRDVSRLLGYDDPDAEEELPTILDVLNDVCSLDEAVVPALDSKTEKPIPNLWVILEARGLDKLEFMLAGMTARELWLHRLMGSLRGRFDLVLIDCPGDMKLATTGALITANEIVGCTKSQEKEARGLTELESKITEIHESYGHTGMRDGVDWVVIGEGVSSKSQGKVYWDIEQQVREAYADVVLSATVRDDVKVAEAYTAGQPVTLYSPKSDAAEAYVKIGRQMKLYR
ncbi:ParA family protein [Streptomyces sp. H10-C2]|uniref:ParA family protein n=1 Tax=unclassified Streptomyces TaxID=2593676 RepID=UPI0024BA1DAB|nr:MULTISPECIES: ParA family protein [unclassified Streptomyces]MDJ0345888.1 ParA family protein [Streptomyces sp. PH10-H1]MDJ0374737.1 ParA family protein [Streptomyces sp. H10-C2]